jgi:hypothetical protein
LHNLLNPNFQNAAAAAVMPPLPFSPPAHSAHRSNSFPVQTTAAFELLASG